MSAAPSPGAQGPVRAVPVVSAAGARTETPTLLVALSWGPLAALRGASGLSRWPRRGPGPQKSCFLPHLGIHPMSSDPPQNNYHFITQSGRHIRLNYKYS